MKIAVIGTGIAGMSAAWLLNQRHQITVYEKNNRPGGHSNTFDAATAGGTIPVDTGFIVYNPANYPNLTELFKHLEVTTKPSEMSFAVSLENGKFEYSGTGLNGLLGQRHNIFRPRFWRMMVGLLKFYRNAPSFLSAATAHEMTLGDYLSQNGYDPGFINDHLLPMGAAIWSTTIREMAQYPAQSFIRFFHSHGLLKLKNCPEWRTVDGGSRAYVEALTAPYRDRIRYVGVRRVRRLANSVIVEDQQGDFRSYDHVVIAAHADEALQMLADADPLENELLGAWRYTANRAVLHRDPSLMPKRRRIWSSWNFMESTGSTDRQLCVTYWMNRLQLPQVTTPLFMTLNPTHEPDAEKTMQSLDYSHPFFNAAALASQQRLWSLQGNRRTWYCGSYFGYGFHEDGLQSGLAVGEQLGGTRRPWSVSDENGRIFVHPSAKSDVA
ncbi:MAG: FAD-dependent oxidoreductase [Rhodospirillales bacterium]|nr:FAD-dependent oxidoreductase [Rhodospirillales bacterium]